MGGGGQDGCERRIEVLVKIQKKNIFFLGGGGGSGRGGGGGGVRGGVWVDVNREVFVKFQPKKIFFLGGGVRVDMNVELNFL